MTRDEMLAAADEWAGDYEQEGLDFACLLLTLGIIPPPVIENVNDSTDY